jgi:hypothetical protein
MRVIDEAKAPIAEEIVARVLAGESFRAVAVDLNSRGIPAPRKGTSWRSGAVRDIASNPALAGMTRRLGDVVRAEDGLPVVDPTTALVDVATFERLRAMTSARGVGFKPRTLEGDRFLLDGVAQCQCGGRMRGHRSSRGYGNYRCARSAGGACSPTPAISEKRLDGLVVARYLDVLGDVEIIEARTEVDPAVEQERALIAADVAAVTAALANAKAAEIGDLAARLGGLRLREESLRETLPMVVMVGTGETYGERWEAADVAGRRQLLADVIDSLVVSQGRTEAGVAIRTEDRVALRFGWTGDEAEDAAS